MLHISTIPESLQLDDVLQCSEPEYDESRTDADVQYAS